MLRKLIVLVFFFTLIFPSAVYAKNGTFSPKPKPSNSPLSVANQGEEKQNRITAVRRVRIRNFFNQMTTRIEALIERLNKLITRMEARIAKIKEGDTDIDTASAEKNISDAKVKIADAQAKVDTAKTDLETVLASDDPKETFKGVKKTLLEIKQDLKDAHNLLVQAIGEIKGLRVGNTVKPTATPE